MRGGRTATRVRVGLREQRFGVRAGAVVLAVCVAGALGLPAASARSSAAVPIPEHEDDSSTLTLLGASSSGVAVLQSTGAGFFDARTSQQDEVLTGAEGGQLVHRTALDPNQTDLSGPSAVSVVGSTLAWQQRHQRAGSQPYTVNRLNLLSGQNVEDGTMPEAQAYTGTEWLSDKNISTVVFPPPAPVLRAYAGDGTPDSLSLPGTDLVAYSGSTAAFTADAHSALRAYQVTSSDPDAPTYDLDLIDLDHRTTQNVVEGSGEIIEVALSPTTIAWTTGLAGGLGIVVHERARSGGPISSYQDADPLADGSHLAAGDGAAAYLDGVGGGDPVMRVVTGSTARSVGIPVGSSGIAAVGDRFLTAVGGRADVAGVYSYDGTALTRTATVPSAGFPIGSIALAGSRLYYSDASTAGPHEMSLWSRPVTGGRHPAFGPDAPLSTQPAIASKVVTASPISFSAGRGVVEADTGGWRILDRGVQTGLLDGGDTAKVSGPYVLSGGKVHDPEGVTLFTEPAPDGSHVASDDLFGGTLVYAVQSDDGQDTTIWTVKDVLNPAPQQVTEFTAAGGCDGRTQVAIWGATIAWDGCDGYGIHVQNLTTGARRLVNGTGGHTYTVPLTLGEGTLAWSDSLGTSVVDLTSTANSLTPVVLPGSADAIALDGHYLGRQLTTSGRTPSYDLQTLPFTPKYAPRLIGTYAPLGFTPDGDGHADTWNPQFDVSKPLRDAKLTISDSSTGRVLRTLTGTAPDGSIRDLSWDGKDKKGTPVTVGLYRWTLTARADDGEGQLIAPDGGSSVTGTIEVDAVTPAGTKAAAQR